MQNLLSIVCAAILLFFSFFSYAQKPTLIITGASTWPPFSFINEEGEADGMLVDFWQDYAIKSNVDVHFQFLPLETLSTAEMQAIYQKWLPAKSNKSYIDIETLAGIALILCGIALVLYHRQLAISSTKLEFTLKALNDSTSRLKNISEVDALTGAKTRHQFFTELNDKRFSNSPYAVVVLGVDKLKLINERHGQDIGDLVLKHFTYQLKWQLSEHLYARLCGGEFAILFDGTEKKGAENRVKQFQKNLKANPLQIDQQTITVEASSGIACYPFDEKKGEALVGIAAHRMRSSRCPIEQEIENTGFSPAMTQSFS